MRSLIALTAGLTLLLAHVSSMAQIYETTDGEGTPVFSDTPVDASSHEVGLPETNISDAPPPESHAGDPADIADIDPAAASSSAAGERFEDPNQDLWEERVRTVEEEKRLDASNAHETLDSEGRREVLDAEPRHQVHDAEPRHQVHDAEPRHQVHDAEPRHEVR